MEASAPPIHRRLFESADGIVDWTCEMPRARTRIGEVCGDGYAEVLHMTVPPWKLPIDELRWGRFHGQGAWRCGSSGGARCRSGGYLATKATFNSKISA